MSGLPPHEWLGKAAAYLEREWRGSASRLRCLKEVATFLRLERIPLGSPEYCWDDAMAREIAKEIARE